MRPSRSYGCHYWPTLDELRDVTASMRTSTVNQILHGQGYWYGYEVETSIDNTIPAYSDYDKIEVNLNKGKEKKKERQTRSRRIFNEMIMKVNKEQYEKERQRVRFVRKIARLLHITHEEAFNRLKAEGHLQ